MLPLQNGVSSYVRKSLVPKVQSLQLLSLNGIAKDALDHYAKTMTRNTLIGSCFFGVAGFIFGVKLGAHKDPKDLNFLNLKLMDSTLRILNAMEGGVICGAFGTSFGAFVGMTAPVSVPALVCTWFYARHVQILSDNKNAPTQLLPNEYRI